MSSIDEVPVEVWPEPDIFYRSECSICRIEINYRTKEPYYSQKAHIHLQHVTICAGSKAPLLWFRITKEQISENEEKR